MTEINRREFLEIIIPASVGTAMTVVPITKALADRVKLSAEKETERVESEITNTPSETLHIESNVTTSATKDLAPVYGEGVMKWKDDVYRWAREHRIDVDLIASIAKNESGGDPNAEAFPGEDRGGKGLFQVTPDKFAKGENWRDPDTNARKGLTYLAGLLRETDGQIEPAIAGYTGGHVAAQWHKGEISRQEYVDFINKQSSYSYLDGEQKAQQVEAYVERVTGKYNEAKEWGILQLSYMVDQRAEIERMGINLSGAWKISSPPQGIVWHQVGDKPGTPEKPFELDKYDGKQLMQGLVGWSLPAYHFLVGTKLKDSGFAECYWLQSVNLGTYHIEEKDPERYSALSISFVDSEYDGCPPTEEQYNTMLALSVHLARNLHIPVEGIVGHRSISPEDRRDPVGVDMNLVREEIKGASAKR